MRKIFVIKVDFNLCFQKFWIVQNLFPTIRTLNKINAMNKAKTISTFDIGAFYKTNDHNLFIIVFSEISFFNF